MDKIKLEYFISVAQHMSFGLAAQEHHVVTSTVSRQIALLEEELGTQLFYRDTHKVKLTPAGRRLFANAHTYRSMFHNIDENVQNLMNMEEHRLYVAAGPYEFPLLTQAAAAFRDRDPALALHPVLNRYDRYINQMRADAIHLFFAIRQCADQLPGCEAASLGFHQWRVVARKDSPYWDMPVEQQREFHGFKVIRSLHETLDPIVPWMNQHGIKPRAWSVAGAFNLACVQVGSGGGVAILPEYLESYLPPDLRMEQIFRDPLVTESVLIFNPESPNPYDRKFFEFVRDEYNAKKHP